MDQTKLGIGTRLQHTRMGPGVIVGVRYATYLISFLNVGLKDVEKTDPDLDEIQPENVTAEVETVSEVDHDPATGRQNPEGKRHPDRRLFP